MSEANLPTFDKRDSILQNKAKIVFGHWVYKGIEKYVEGTEPQYLTIVREPSSQIVSQYNFSIHRRRIQGKKVISFELWYRIRNPKNPQCSHMIRHFFRKKLKSVFVTKGDYNKIIEELNTFWFVGETDKLSSYFPKIPKSQNPKTNGRKERVRKVQCFRCKV